MRDNARTFGRTVSCMAAKSVAAKLLVKPDTSYWTSHPDHDGLLEPLPQGASRSRSLGSATVAVLYAYDEAAARALLARHEADLLKPEVLWIAYRKGNRADINRDTLWPIVAEYGLRPITQVAVDDEWSALRFRPLRDGEAQFIGGR